MNMHQELLTQLYEEVYVLIDTPEPNIKEQLYTNLSWRDQHGIVWFTPDMSNKHLNNAIHYVYHKLMRSTKRPAIYDWSLSFLILYHELHQRACTFIVCKSVSEQAFNKILHNL